MHPEDITDEEIHAMRAQLDVFQREQAYEVYTMAFKRATDQGYTPTPLTRSQFDSLSNEAAYTLAARLQHMGDRPNPHRCWLEI